MTTNDGNCFRNTDCGGTDKNILLRYHFPRRYYRDRYKLFYGIWMKTCKRLEPPASSDHITILFSLYLIDFNDFLWTPIEGTNVLILKRCTQCVFLSVRTPIFFSKKQCYGFIVEKMIRSSTLWEWSLIENSIKDYYSCRGNQKSKISNTDSNR